MDKWTKTVKHSDHITCEHTVLREYEVITLHTVLYYDGVEQSCESTLLTGVSAANIGADVLAIGYIRVS